MKKRKYYFSLEINGNGNFILFKNTYVNFIIALEMNDPNPHTI